MKKRMLHILAIGVLGGALTGCTHTIEGVKEDAKNLPQETQKASKTFKEKAIETPKIKSAIVADKELNDSRNLIDVDTKDNTVHLKGHVINAHLKNKASQIAAQVIKENNYPYKLSNELTIQ